MICIFKYMNLNNDSAFNHVKKLINSVKLVNGVFTLLWHNNSFDGYNKECFIRIIKFLKKEDVWFATSKQIIEWYQSNSYFKEIKKILQKLRPLENE